MKKIFALVLVFILTMTLMTGCAKTDDASENTVSLNVQTGGNGQNADYKAIYADILSRFCDAAAGKNDTVFDGETGVWEATMGRSAEEGLGVIGYAIKDISGDGIPELIIGSLDENEETGMTYALYSCAKGEPQLVFEGYARNRICYAGENRFVLHGSSGAAYTVCGEFALSEDGTALNCVELWFTEPKNDDFDDIGYYHNHSGSADAADAEEEITEDQFIEKYNALSEKAKAFELTALSVIAKPENNDATTGSTEMITENTTKNTAEPVRNATITAWWAEDVLQELADYREYVAVEGDPQARVVFKTDTEVTNFKFRSVFLENVDDDGVFHFSETEMYEMDKFSPDCPLLIDLVFYGDLPGYGISYTDTNGAVKNYAVGVSGYDGSIDLIEY